jgi:hypothetical protein
MNNMNISNEHLLLINILNTMYNDNNRQIQQLTEQNSRIINIITDILRVPNIRQQGNRNPSNRQQCARQPNARNNVLLNNRQYIVDDIQRFEMPFPTVVGTGIEGRLTGNYRDAAASTSAARGAAHPQTENVNNSFSSLFQNFFDPVLIYPTNAQIETATRRVLYRDIVTPINNTCPISMENFNDDDTVTIIRHCGHIFNTDELNTWFESNCRCPVCRYDIRNYNRNSSSSRSNALDISGNTIYQYH